jgi:IS5 family transposase
MALADTKPVHLLADKGYDSDAIRDFLRRNKVTPLIPPRSSRKTVIRWNRRIYKGLI